MLQSLDTLGAGFQLASHDLDIRGAGNLLGDEQSGHIKEVGFELYQQMLEEAVAALKAGVEEPAEEQWSPTITVGAPVMIPESYVARPAAAAGPLPPPLDLETDGEIDAFAAELIDRFGPLPAEVEQLLKIMAIKVLCRRANVEKVEAGPKGVIVSFRDNAFANPAGLVAYVAEQASFAKVRPDMKIVFIRDVEDARRAPQGDDGDPAQPGADRGAEEGCVSDLEPVMAGLVPAIPPRAHPPPWNVPRPMEGFPRARSITLA